MGSEQSAQAAGGEAGTSGRQPKPGSLRRGKSVPNRESLPDDTPPRCTSPGLSVCSDSDLPYISYTVNRPIGDSPKMNNKQSLLLRGKSLGASSSSAAQEAVQARRKQASLYGKPASYASAATAPGANATASSDKGHNIVVVKAAASDPTADRDPDLQKLKDIPMFLPIMRGTLNLPPRVRDPEVLERLDPIGLFNLCARYQHHLNLCAQTVATEQNALCTNIDGQVNKLMLLAAERQKRFAKLAEQLTKVQELSRQLTKCHMQLNQTLESLETLNNLLPVEERLEPFVWTTG